MNEEPFNGSVVSGAMQGCGVITVIVALMLMIGGAFGVAIGVFSAAILFFSLAYFAAGGDLNPVTTVDSLADPTLPEALQFAVCVIRLGVVVAAADGEVDQREVVEIAHLFEDSLKDPKLRRWYQRELVAATRPGMVRLPQILEVLNTRCGPTERELAFYAVSRVAFADGRFVEQEASVLAAIANGLNLDEAVIRRVFRSFGQGNAHECDDDNGDDVELEEDDSHEQRRAYATLGLSFGASVAEVKLARRELVKRYHPDSFAHLGEDFRLVAESRVRDIDSAYSQIMKAFT